MTQSESPRPGIRLWPLFVIVGLAVALIVYIKQTSDADRQSGNMNVIMTSAMACLLVALWFVGFSRLAARVRVMGVVLGIACAGVFFFGLEFRGVSGDLVPIFKWTLGSADTQELEVAATLPEVDSKRLEGLADSPQFFGPQRDGKLRGPEFARDWTARPPEVVWRREVGAAWSGFSVAGRRAITQEQLGADEAIVCYDILTGSVLWVHRDKVRYDHPVAGVGPRATPTIEGDRVYTQGSTGLLHCLSLETGEEIWSVDIIESNDAVIHEWGVAGSPLIVDDKIVVSVGGEDDRSLVAYSKKDGKLLWGKGAQPAQWSSPFRCTLAGIDQILIFNTTEMTAHDATTGDILWSYEWKANHPHVCLPVILDGDRVFLSTGYGTGCQLIQIAKDDKAAFTATRIWRSRAMKAKFTNVIEKDGYIYGLDDGIMACIDTKRGRRQWKQGRYGHGQILLVGDVLLIMTEAGEVVLLDPMPDEARELARFEVFTDKTWNPPTVAGRYVLVRNDREAVCLRLPIVGE